MRKHFSELYTGLLRCLVVAVTPGMSNEQHFLHNVLFTEGSLGGTPDKGCLCELDLKGKADVYFIPKIKIDTVLINTSLKTGTSKNLHHKMNIVLKMQFIRLKAVL